MPCGYTPGFSTEGEGKHAHLPASPWKGVTACFPSCCRLRVQFLISLYLGAAFDLPLFLIIITHDGLGTPSNTESHQEHKWQLRWAQSFEKLPGTQVGLTNKVHLLHRTSLSKLEEVAVFCFLFFLR